LPALFTSVTFAATLDEVNKQDNALRALEKERQQALTQSLERTPNQLQPSEKTIFRQPVLGEVPCFNVKNITLIGTDADQFHGLTQNLDGFTNACLGIKSLEALQANLNGRLLTAGYVTSRVTLPDQQLSQNTLVLQLHTGRVSDISLQDIQPLDWFTLPWATLRNAVPIAKNDILNIRDLDQGLEQLKRLSSQEISIAIEPAEVEDASNIIIKRQQSRRLHGQLSTDNAGSASLGREQVQLGVTLDAPLGFSDQLSFYASSNTANTAVDHRNQSASVYYSIPFGYHTFSTSFGYSRFGQLVQGTTVQFLSHGLSQNAQAKWHTTVMRDATSKLGVFGAVSTRRARSYIDDVELLTQHRRTSAAELGLTYAKKWQTASLNAELVYSRGLDWFQAESRFADDTASEQPTTRPNIWHGSAELNLPLPMWNNALTYNTRLQWQTTPKLALSIDQFSIGSRYSVRGFDGDIILQGESGYSLRNEISLRGIALLDNKVYLSPYIALDVGHIWGPSVMGSPYTTLAGSALGLRAQNQYLSADFALSTPLYKPEGFTTRTINPMVQISFSI